MSGPCRFGDSCLGHPQMPEGWTSWQEALHADDTGQAYSEWLRTEPVTRAESMGHTVEWDPPAAMTKALRWTCTSCGQAVIRYEDNIYGGAVERRCEEARVDA